MNKLYVILLAGIFSGCSSSKMGSTPNTLTNKEKKEGWQLLFDGVTTNGWHTYGKKNIKVWKVEDGALHLDPSAKKMFANAGGDLVTDEEFDNFDLQLDWKISPKGNSGVMIYVKEDSAKYKEAYFTGPEMQVVDNDGHPDGKIFKHQAGDLYDLVPSSKKAAKPVGEWNHMEITSNNGKLDLYLNGVHTVSTTMWDDNWRTMVAGSKFKAWPDFAKFKKGRIDLQDHGDEVWYRNIKVRKL
jgi:hypothetical protein